MNQKSDNGVVVFDSIDVYKKHKIAWEKDEYGMKQVLEELGLTKHIIEVDPFRLSVMGVRLKIQNISVEFVLETNCIKYHHPYEVVVSVFNENQKNEHYLGIDNWERTEGINLMKNFIKDHLEVIGG